MISDEDRKNIKELLELLHTIEPQHVNYGKMIMCCMCCGKEIEVDAHVFRTTSAEIFCIECGNLKAPDGKKQKDHDGVHIALRV